MRVTRQCASSRVAVAAGAWRPSRAASGRPRGGLAYPAAPHRCRNGVQAPGPTQAAASLGAADPGVSPGLCPLFLAGDGLFTTCTSGRSAPRLILGPLVSARLTPGLTSRPGSSRSGRGGWGKLLPNGRLGSEPKACRDLSQDGRIQRPAGLLLLLDASSVQAALLADVSLQASHTARGVASSGHMVPVLFGSSRPLNAARSLPTTLYVPARPGECDCLPFPHQCRETPRSQDSARQSLPPGPASPQLCLWGDQGALTVAAERRDPGLLLARRQRPCVCHRTCRPASNGVGVRPLALSGLPAGGRLTPLAVGSSAPLLGATS